MKKCNSCGLKKTCSEKEYKKHCSKCKHVGDEEACNDCCFGHLFRVRAAKFHWNNSIRSVE